MQSSPSHPVMPAWSLETSVRRAPLQASYEGVAPWHHEPTVRAEIGLRTREARPVDLHRCIAGANPRVAALRGAIEALVAKEGLLKGARVLGVAAGDARACV